jgi:putative ABC transport system permease protein
MIKRSIGSGLKKKNFPTEMTKSTILIDRQVSLPLQKSIEIAFKSIRVRFFRSLITIMSLVLAISFLSFINVSTDIANGMLAAHDFSLRQALIRSGYDLEQNENSVANSPKQKWLVILSLLVCVVGIVNAQLMAVTERFREIGTMKCLGALNRFVLRLFLLEAGMQGLAGAGIGAVFGALCALFIAFLRFGFKAVTAVGWQEVAVSISIATSIGLILSLAGVLYPAIVAARMHPVEAMRAEH